MEMLYVILAAYCLLALPVRGSVRVRILGMHGTTAIALRAAGLTWRREKALKLPIKKKKKPHIAQRILRQAVRIGEVTVTARVGLDDAMKTAMAVGGVRAAVFSALGAFGLIPYARVRVTPDFEQAGFEISLSCIFSLTLGDIMLSAAKSALKKNGNEGMRWSGIQLKA